MTRETDSPGTRTRDRASNAVATLARLAAIALAIPATLALIQTTGRVLTGVFLLSDTWLTGIIIVYVQTALSVFNWFSPRSFNELDPTIQGLLVFIPNLVLVVIGIWSLISLATTVKR